MMRFLAPSLALGVLLLAPAAHAQANADGRMAAGCMSVYTTLRGQTEGAARERAADRLKLTLLRLQRAVPKAEDGQALVGEEAAALRQRITAAPDRPAFFATLVQACDAWLDDDGGSGAGTDMGG